MGTEYIALPRSDTENAPSIAPTATAGGLGAGVTVLGGPSTSGTVISVVSSRRAQRPAPLQKVPAVHVPHETPVVGSGPHSRPPQDDTSSAGHGPQGAFKFPQ